MSIAAAPPPVGARSHLTKRQSEVLNALAAYQRLHGYPPALRELGDLVGIQSPSVVRHHLAALQHKGYIRRTPRRPRAVMIVRLPEETIDQ